MTGFTGATLDRADKIRGDAAAFAAALRSPRARLLRLDGLDPAVGADGRLAWGSIAELPNAAEPILLGLDGEIPCFVGFEREAARDAPGGRGPWRALGLLPAEDAALWGAARSLLLWHARHGHCANCGTATVVHRAGWGRRCGACAAEHFPRVDPVVIMLAEHGGRVLLGRQPRFPASRYSALAGFVEPGESLEEAVARELWEEAGVRATAVRYVASQPWPFPSQLMIACVATVSGNEITLDRDELEHAIWCSEVEVRAALVGDEGAPFLPPPPYAIAHTLLTHWIGE